LSRGASKRRLKVRRKRRGESVADVLDEGADVVANFGCCLIEAVGAMSILAGLLAVPLFLLVR
jgi:hypothetical protein